MNEKMKGGGVFEMVWSCAKQSMQCTSEEQWFIQVKRTKRSRGKQKNDVLIKEVTYSMILDGIEWRKRIYVNDSN